MSSRPSRGAARLAAILDALPDALVLVNANGTVVNANTIALEAFEAPGTALVGRGLLDLLPQFDSRLIPGTMRRPDSVDESGRTRPTRMIARRTDGSEFPVEVTSANLENGQQAYDGYGYTSDELLMLVVRDLSGTVDTEAELARSQRQTEMILRAAAEGVVGTDTEGRVVLVNPAAAQILGFRASDLGGQELHPLMLHSRADGEPFPYEESPLADTLRSGRKHRVRGQVLWSKNGDRVPVDLTTAPVRDGDQLVGAVMTFTDRRPYDTLAEEKDAEAKRHQDELARAAEEHAEELTALRDEHAGELAELRERHEEELAAGDDRYAALAEREKDRYEALSARHDQLLAVLGRSLRGPLDQLRSELSALAADDAGQLWPEANQVLHHLSAGYSRITTLVDNVLAYQRLDSGTEAVTRTKVMLDAVVAAGVDGAVELIGPGRVQFAVHAPPIEAEVDPQRLATALAHLVADVAGVDSTGNSPVSAGGYMDNTVVVAAAQRGEVVRIEVRGPYAGGDPVHEPIVRGIVRAHGGVLQTHEVPGMSGSAFVLEVPIGGGAGAVPAPGAGAGTGTGVDTGSASGGGEAGGAGSGGGVGSAVALPEQASPQAGGRRRARRASVDAFLESEVGPPTQTAVPTGRRRRAAGEEAQPQPALPAQVSADEGGAEGSGGTGRRRGRPSPAEGGGVSEGAVVTAAEHAAGTAATGLGETVPPQGVPAPAGGRRARRDGERQALPAALPAAPSPAPDASAGPGAGAGAGAGADGSGGAPQPTGRRRRALAAAAERAAAQEAGPRAVFALPPAEADRSPEYAAQHAEAHGQAAPGQAALAQAPHGQAAPGQAPAQAGNGRHDVALHDSADDHTPPQPHPVQAPSGRRRARQAAGELDGATTTATSAAGTTGVAGAPGVPGQVGPVQVAPQAPGMPGAPAATGQAMAIPGQAVAVPGEGAPGQAVPGQGAPGQGMPAQLSPVQGVAGQAMPLPGQLPPAQGVPGEGTPPQAASGQPQPVPVPAQGNPGQGAPVQAGPVPGQAVPPQGMPQPGAPVPGQALPPQALPGQATPAGALAPAGTVGPGGIPAAATPTPAQDAQGTQTPARNAQSQPPPQTPADAAVASQPWPGAVDGSADPEPAPVLEQPRAAQPLPAEATPPSVDPNSTQGRAFSVRTLGQGVPFGRRMTDAQQPRPSRPVSQTPQPLPQAQAQAPVQSAPQPQPQAHTPPPHATNGSGRRRKLGTRPEPVAEAAEQAETAARPTPQSGGGQSRLANVTEGTGRSYAIGAPDENADEGPEPLDGPGGAVEVANQPQPQPMDDELPPEPLDNPRRLLVWPAPDITTQQALSDRGYRPVIVHSREEVAAQIAAFPAALFVDPLTGPITRTALQSLRQAAVAAEVPVLVTAGLGQATREAAYGADPAVLLKALAPRDSEQHPPRVLLIEEHAEIALALTSTLERRGMQVARASSDEDAVTLASQMRPNLVVMDLMQVRRRRAGIVDWLRANGQLNRTPLVVYTAAVDQTELPRLAAGETVLFLAERSTSTEVQGRIVDLLARIGTN
ncbi:PAS domain-containing protein [Streptomyces sp. NBC_00878]|uniref:hybrid sensor histidine kinase/response regulator n=1 Tax=Streptomyces sp. NBC_00878 TaxID=2975854 RepID=UPI00224CE9B2|nr:PAS domain-containing protein [Streptomyces sp. NBC_00878]MCX4907045.1 PAS domain-containing protein [Streptomyces sp. NBC_00878]